MYRLTAALAVSGVMALALVGGGVWLFADMECGEGDECTDALVAIFLGVPAIVLGAVLATLVGLGWRRRSPALACASCLVSAFVVISVPAYVGSGGGVVTIVLAAAALGLVALAVAAARAPRPARA